MLDVNTSFVAEDALLSVFVTRADLFDELEFDEAYWSDLNPERAFLARVFVDHCIATKVFTYPVCRNKSTTSYNFHFPYRMRPVSNRLSQS